MLIAVWALVGQLFGFYNVQSLRIRTSHGIYDMSTSGSISRSPEIGRTVDALGIRTNLHDEGSGAPVLLIHGSGPGVTAWANWRTVIPALSKRFRVLAPDLLGFGFSDMPAGPICSQQAWIDHLVRLIDALNLDTVSLVGNSFGGAIALAMLVQHPERVRRCVLMGAVGLEFPITTALDRIWGYQPSQEGMREALGMLAYDHSRLNDELIRSRYEASIRPGVYETYSQTFGKEPRQRHITLLATPEDEIRRVQHEVLILHGKQDQVIPMDVSLRLGTLLSRSDVHLFTDCGHWVQIERAQSFNRLVDDFLTNGLHHL